MIKTEKINERNSKKEAFVIECISGKSRKIDSGGNGMNLHQIRYTFEHKLLPQWFFEMKDKFAGMLLHEEAILYKLIDDMFKNEGQENPYTPEQFRIEAAKPAEGIMMLKLIFPEPEDEPLCYCSYLFFDNDFEKTGYFCIEKGYDPDDDSPFVCAWTPEGAHVNYGICSFEGQGDFFRCVDIYMEKE